MGGQPPLPSCFSHLAMCEAEPFFTYVPPLSKKTPKNRSLNKLGRAIVAAAGDSLKLSAPTLQEIKFMKSVLKRAQRSPKAKVELDKRGIVLICAQGEEKKRQKKATGQSNWSSAKVCKQWGQSCSKCEFAGDGLI